MRKPRRQGKHRWQMRNPWADTSAISILSILIMQFNNVQQIPADSHLPEGFPILRSISWFRICKAIDLWELLWIRPGGADGSTTQMDQKLFAPLDCTVCIHQTLQWKIIHLQYMEFTCKINFPPYIWKIIHLIYHPFYSPWIFHWNEELPAEFGCKRVEFCLCWIGAAARTWIWSIPTKLRGGIEWNRVEWNISYHIRSYYTILYFMLYYMIYNFDVFWCNWLTSSLFLPLCLLNTPVSIVPHSQSSNPSSARSLHLHSDKDGKTNIGTGQSRFRSHL